MTIVFSLSSLKPANSYSEYRLCDSYKLVSCWSDEHIFTNSVFYIRNMEHGTQYIMKKIKKNPVARFMYEGETGWKSTSKVHNSKKKYKRNKKVSFDS